MLSPFSVTRKGTLKSNNGVDNKNFKKAIGLYVKQLLSMYSTLFFYIPLPLLQGHDVKWRISLLIEDVKTLTKKVSFFF